MTNLFGIEITDEQVDNIIAYMESNAQPYEGRVLTYEEWEKEFAPDMRIKTPIGTVKLGENQFAKMYNAGRGSKFGMIKPTLQSPDIIVTSESKPKQGKPVERDFSYVYVKSFVGKDGKRIYRFTSVTNLIDGTEISISNQEKKAERIKRLIKSGKLVYIKSATMPSTPASIAHGSQPTVRGGGTSRTKVTKKSKQAKSKAKKSK